MPSTQDPFYLSDNTAGSDLTDDDVELPRNLSQTPNPGRGPSKPKSGKGGKKPVKKPPSPYLNKSGSKKDRAKTPNASREYWLQSLRAGGNGLTAAAKSSDYMGISGKGNFRPSTLDNCSDYLKETVLGMPPKRRSRGNTMNGTMMRSTKGTPAYKPQEDMYDDIMDLKKQVNVVTAENDRLKARNRRLEDDHTKKERQIEQLLDPTQGDLRLTLSSRQPDTAAKMSSLKQKNLKMEMVLKEKEAELNKLQSDLKSTKIEEMKVAMETFYSEVQRLRHQLTTNGPTTPSSARNGKHNSPSHDNNNTFKVKALNATIMRLTENNQRLQSENKLLKTDLERALDEGASSDDNSRKSKQKEYEDMNRRELLKTIAVLAEKVEKAEGSLNKSSQRKLDVPGKIELSGSLADRLDRLDKRESELLGENQKLTKELARLKDDKSKLRQKVEDLEDESMKQREEIKVQQKEIADLRSQMREDRKSIQRHPSKESLQSHRSSKKSHSSEASMKRKKQREEEEWRREQERKAEELRQNRSAKNIQRNWRAHKEKKKEDEDLEQAARTIQSAARGHKSRKEQLDRFSPTTTEIVSDENSDSEVEYAARTIQSAVRGHWTRKDQLNKMSYTDSESESVRSAKSKASSYKKGSHSSKHLDSESDSDDDIIMTPTSGKGSSQHRPSSARRGSKGSISSKSSVKRATTNGKRRSLGGSDDDIMLTPTTRRAFQRD